MHPQGYLLYAVPLSDHTWAVVCEHCEDTIATCCPDRDAAQAALLGHACIPPAELPPACAAYAGRGTVEHDTADPERVYTACPSCGGSGLEVDR
jgi:hypothetical protein